MTHRTPIWLKETTHNKDESFFLNSRKEILTTKKNDLFIQDLLLFYICRSKMWINRLILIDEKDQLNNFIHADTKFQI